MTKIRQIERTHYDIQVTEAEIPTDLRGWLAEQRKRATLLAHADDGLIWGRVADGQTHLAHDAFPDISPQLRPETLWQLWLFAPDSELFLWRDGGHWRQRVISEQAGDEHEYYDERQMLWGMYYQETRDGFTLVHEGQQGLTHAVPMDVPETTSGDQRHSLRLRVRHYLTKDEASGLLRVSLSRLVELYVEEVPQ